LPAAAVRVADEMVTEYPQRFSDHLLSMVTAT
jgi:hypothetical protein